MPDEKKTYKVTRYITLKCQVSGVVVVQQFLHCEFILFVLLCLLFVLSPVLHLNGNIQFSTSDLSASNEVSVNILYVTYEKKTVNI